MLDPTPNAILWLPDLILKSPLFPFLADVLTWGACDKFVCNFDRLGYLIPNSLLLSLGLLVCSSETILLSRFNCDHEAVLFAKFCEVFFRWTLPVLIRPLTCLLEMIGLSDLKLN